MKVLLTKDVKGVGRRMEVKDVSDGYAHNFLIAKGLAVPADKSAIGEKTAHEKTENEHREQFEGWMQKIASTEFKFELGTGSKGEVFGSITKDDVLKKIHALGALDADVQMKKPIREIGFHEIEIKFPMGIKGIAKISIEGQRSRASHSNGNGRS